MMSFANLMPFVGVIEEWSDPSGLGRVKVRVFDVHPEADSSDVPTELLPWAVCLNGTMGALSNPSPSAGEWVFGFFLDGRDAQNPFIIGTIPGNNLGNVEGKYAKNTNEMLENAHGLATPPQSSGIDQEETAQAAASGTREEDVESAGGNQLEPPDIISGGNKVAVFSGPGYSKSHVVVGTDKNSEYIQLAHSSGSVVQMDSQGNITIQSSGDRWDVSKGTSNEVVSGSKDIVVKDGNFNIRVEGNCNMTVNGNMNHKVHGNYILDVAGAFDINVGARTELQAAKIGLFARTTDINMGAVDISIAARDNFSLISKTDINMSTETMRLYTSGEMHALADETMYLTGTGVDVVSVGNINMDASGIVDMQNKKSTAASSSESVAPEFAEFAEPIEPTPERPKGAVQSLPGVSGSSTYPGDDEGGGPF